MRTIAVTGYDISVLDTLVGAPAALAATVSFETALDVNA